MIGTKHAGALALVTALWLAAAPPLAGQIGTQTPPGTAAAQDTVTPSLGEMRDRIERRYQVLPLQTGIVLIPRYGQTDVQSVELTDAGVAINGALVTGPELRQRIGADTDDVLRLSYLDPATRRVLFGIGTPPAPGAPADTALPADTTAVADDADDAAAGEGIDLGAEGDRVRIGGSVTIGEGETVNGDVVAVGGSVTVMGTVTGEVVAVGGSVDLGPDAVVEGAVTAVGGEILQADGAFVGGAVNEVAFGAPQFRFDHDFHEAPPFFDGFGGLIGTVVHLIVLMLLTSLAYLLARRPIERMALRISESPWKTALVGLVAQILFFPVLVLVVVVLAISIIGIPLLLLIPFALVALAIGILLGFTAVAFHVGRGAEARFGWYHANPYLSVLIGVGIVMLVSFFASALGVAGGPIGAIAIALMVIGIIIQYIAWTTGFGALLLTRFGTRARWADGVAAPAPVPPAGPEPAPEAPPVL